MTQICSMIMITEISMSTSTFDGVFKKCTCYFRNVKQGTLDWPLKRWFSTRSSRIFVWLLVDISSFPSDPHPAIFQYSPFNESCQLHVAFVRSVALTMKDSEDARTNLFLGNRSSVIRSKHKSLYHIVTIILYVYFPRTWHVKLNFP